MDFMMVRVVWTVLTVAVFVLIVLWVYSAKARSGFEAAAHLPFADDSGDAAQARTGEEAGR